MKDSEDQEGSIVDLDLAEITRTVRELAAEQGRYVLDQWPAIGGVRYKDRRDVVTDVDVEVETRLVQELRARFPDHGFQGEETGDHNSEADYQWLIDPIDGTKYYVGLASFFSVSIALMFRDTPVLGVVYNVAARQCFYAWKDGGSYLDGLRLTGPKVRHLDEMIANVDTPNTDALSSEERRWFESRLIELHRRVYRVRALGLASLAACWVATGSLDAYVDLTGYVQPPDVGAGRVVMEEAGVRVEYVDVATGPRRLVAAPPDLFDEFRSILLL